MMRSSEFIAFEQMEITDNDLKEEVNTTWTNGIVFDTDECHLACYYGNSIKLS